MKVGKTTCLVCGAKFGNASIKCLRCGTLTPRGMGKSKRQQGRKPAAGPQLAKPKPALPPLGSFLFDDSSSHGSPESPQWELSASSGQAAAGFQLMGDMPLGVSLSQSNLLVQTVARNTTAPLVAVSEPMGNTAPLLERRDRVDESPLYQHGSGVLPSLSPVPFLSTAEERALFEELDLDEFLFVSAHLGDGSISVVLRYEANEMGVDVVKYINQRCQGIEFWSEVSECELPPAISLWWAPNSTKVCLREIERVGNRQNVRVLEVCFYCVEVQPKDTGKRVSASVQDPEHVKAVAQVALHLASRNRQLSTLLGLQDHEDEQSEPEPLQPDAARQLLIYYRGIRDHPDNPQFQSIRWDDENYNRFIAPYPSAEEFLAQHGWVGLLDSRTWQYRAKHQNVGSAEAIAVGDAIRQLEAVLGSGCETSPWSDNRFVVAAAVGAIIAVIVTFLILRLQASGQGGAVQNTVLVYADYAPTWASLAYTIATSLFFRQFFRQKNDSDRMRKHHTGDYEEYGHQKSKIQKLLPPVQKGDQVPTSKRVLDYINTSMVDRQKSLEDFFKLRRSVRNTEFTIKSAYEMSWISVHGLLARPSWDKNVAEKATMMYHRLVLDAINWNNAEHLDNNSEDLPPNWAAVLHTNLIAHDTSLDADILLFDSRPAPPDIYFVTNCLFTAVAMLVPIVSKLLMVQSSQYRHWHGHRVYRAMATADVKFVFENCKENLSTVMDIRRTREPGDLSIEEEKQLAFNRLAEWVAIWEADYATLVPEKHD
eukprot:m.203012 g.203012  ORF g.203012 m.203012 type:complete len:765 (+) comp15368_c0_seq1:407-2701(+)